MLLPQFSAKCVLKSMEFFVRLRAALLHLLVTAVVVAVVASVIFGVWFPGAFSDMVGGKKLFILVLGCDLALGPLISLVIYNRSKPRAELIRDYIVVGVVQLAALSYGVSVVVDSRPVYVAYVVDRLEVITAQELSDEDLALAQDKHYRERGWTGPRLVAVERPESAEERSAILLSSLAGKDIQLMPKYYRPYRQALQQIRERSFPVSELVDAHPDFAAMIESAAKNIDGDSTQVRWLPVRHRYGFWVALIDVDDGKPQRYLAIDPYAG